MKTKPNNTCPQCGALLPSDAPAGICPVCVMAMNLATPTLINENGSAEYIRFEAPQLDEIIPLFPRLEITEQLGQGGMGVVYKARQKELDRVVALKILPKEIGETAGFAERFAREARALGKLNHPNIVTLYEFGCVDLEAGEPLYFFLMEYVDGLNLRRLLNNGRIEAREALSIVPQICDALQYAHDVGVVHRDIKPENILLDRRGNVKVADFGIAKIVDGKEEDFGFLSNEETSLGEKNSTEADKVMGTPEYMAPEQIQAPSAVDHRADIYALGVVFYQMLTGEMPDAALQPPSTKVIIDVRLDEVVMRALEQNPALRYQQASVLKTRVETIGSEPDEPRRAKAWPTQTELDQMSRDTANWRLYFFYFCRRDPRVVVPKRISGLGWTINFANPMSVPFLVLLIGVMMGIVNLSRWVGLTGQSLLVVKIALVVGVVWMCHKLSLAREPASGIKRFLERIAVVGGVLVVVFGAFFVRETPSVEPTGSRLEQLARNPQQLRERPTERVIAAGMTDLDLPWAWNELRRRVENGLIGADGAERLTGSFISWLYENHPRGYDRPLHTLGSLLEELDEKGLLSDERKVQLLSRLNGPPTIKQLPRVLDGDTTLPVVIRWRGVWNRNLFGIMQLNELKTMTFDGKAVKAPRVTPSLDVDECTYMASLPRLAAETHQLRCEIDQAYVMKSSAAGLDQASSAADWPEAIFREVHVSEAEFKVFAEGVEPIRLIDDPRRDPVANKGLILKSVSINSAKNGSAAKMTVIFSSSDHLAVPVSADISIRLNGKTHACGHLVVYQTTDGLHRYSSGERNSVEIPKPPEQVGAMDVILTPNAKHVERKPDVEEIWGDRIIFQNPAVERFDIVPGR